MNVRHVILLRHGATAHSASGRYSGRVDYPLSELGWRQAERWRSTLASAENLRVRTSPLSRAADTATAAGFARALRDERLLEWDLGCLEGVEADRFRRENPEWNLFLDGPPARSGESPAAVQVRARTVVESAATEAGQIVVLVSHGQFLRALALEFLGLPIADGRALSLGPARAGLLTRRGARWSLTGWNILPVEGMFDDLT
ncbi:histidine phosphatase family protein [Microbacterium ureisolvens]|uniref:Histidine phosphatase family protein n=1 Tax=Microbacterium ureisolvens TaxID=2781186 RepID=A0ABS7I2H9_9MICO|nr:histidine phosphatase family protein [Microbacterium ureisolvens]